MKKVLLSLMLSLCTFFAFTQNVTLKGNFIEVRDAQGKYISSGSFDNVNSVGSASDYILIGYKTGRLETRTLKLEYIASANLGSLTWISIQGDGSIYLVYKSGLTEIRDKKFTFISSNHAPTQELLR